MPNPGPGTNYNGQWNANVSISLTDDFGFAVTAECIGNPNVVAEDTNIYATGCQMTRKDILTGSNVYFNTGTKANPLWTLGGGGGVTGVTSLNGISGAVILAAGTNISLNPSGNTITISATGGSQVYPGAGIPVSTGSAWAASISGTSSQFIKGDGSLDSSTYLTTSSASSTYIPYTGGTSNVDLGVHNLTVDTTSLFVDSVNHRVGFGTITPNQVVDIFGANNQLRISSGAASLQSIYFYDNTTNSAAIYARNDSSNGLHIENRLSGGALYLGGNTSQKDITILNSGNVGINNITPLFKADIIGTSVTQGTAILSNSSEIFGVSSSDVLPELAIGAYSGSPFAVWVQGKRHDNNATAYPIVLQPAGGNLGIGTTAPTKDLSFGNNAAKTFWIENSATDVVGRALTIAAGSTIAGTSTNNVAGGQLILQGGLGTGTADSSIAFQTGTTLTTGKVLQTMSTKMIILGTGQVGIGVTALRNTTDIFQAQGNVLIGDTTGGSTMTLQADYTGAGFPNGTSLTISAGVTHVSTGNGGGLTFNAGNGGGVTGVGGGIVFNSGSGGTAAGAISFKPGGVGNAAVYTFNGITTFGYAQSVGGGAIQLAAGAVSNSLGSNVYITASPGGIALGPNLGGSIIIAAGTGNGSAALGAGAAGNIQISGNTGIWTSSPTANFQVNQSTTGPGTVTVSGTAVTGTGTQFLNTFKVGDTITVTTTSGAETKAISAIASNTSMTTAAFAGTAATNIGYTLTGGNLVNFAGNGNVGIGVSLASLSAVLHLKAGTATAGTAPLKLTSGTLLSTTEAGAIEFASSHLYFTAANSGTRYQLDQQLAAVPPTMTLSSDFSNASRYDVTVTGSGTNTFGDTGLQQTVGAGAATGSALATYVLGGQTNMNVYNGSPTFSLSVRLSDLTSNPGSSFLGLGNVTVGNTGHTYTSGSHVGFKILQSGGVVSLYGTQADGTGEAATAALTTLAVNDDLDLIFVINGTSSVDYYWRKNGGALSAATNLTTKVPTTNDNNYQFSVSNNSQTSFWQQQIAGVTYKR